MSPTLYLRSATALATTAALSMLLAAGPGPGGPTGGHGPHPQNSQGAGQGNQQCPPGQGQSQGAQNQSGASGQGQSNGQQSLMDPAGGGGNAGGGNQPGQGPNGGQANRQRGGESIAGTVSSYNLNPMGAPESLMLNTGKSIVQMNFPPDMASAVQAAVAVGSQVTVTARSGGPGGEGGPDEQQQANHQVMNLESIKTAGGRSISIAGPGGGQDGQVEGAVKTLNYDRRGQVDGAQLDNGAFVHLHPGSEANLTVGQKVSVQGREHTTKSGLKIIEAESINGASVGGNGPGGGPAENGGPNGAGAPGQ